jgi:hypothetical protein
MVENGLERATSFSLDSLAERYTDMYARAVSAGGAPGRGGSGGVHRRRRRLL